jgi:hypothetical protein
MKPSQFFAALLIMFVSAQICFAQKQSDIELFDNFGALGCSDLRGRIDNYLMTLVNETDASGYVVFYGGNNLITFSFYENAVKSQVKLRRFPEGRVKLINAKPQTDFKVEFWISRNDAKPEIAESENALILNPNNNHYLFAGNAVEIDKISGRLAYFHESECTIEAVNFRLLAKYLATNPEMNAEILVYDRKKNRAGRVMKLFLNEAQEKYKIPARRLKIRYSGIDRESAGTFNKISIVKIWLIPSKKRT